MSNPVSPSSTAKRKRLPTGNQPSDIEEVPYGFDDFQLFNGCRPVSEYTQGLLIHSIGLVWPPRPLEAAQRRYQGLNHGTA